MKLCLLHVFPSAHPHSRKERERRPQVVRRSVPDSGVLIRLKAQMAEVRSKMSNVKSQVMEVRGSDEARPGPSGGFGVGKDSELSACLKPSELDLLERAAAARSRPGRPGERSFTPDARTGGAHLNRRFCVQPGNLCPLSWRAVALWL